MLLGEIEYFSTEKHSIYIFGINLFVSPTYSHYVNGIIITILILNSC